MGGSWGTIPSEKLLEGDKEWEIVRKTEKSAGTEPFSSTYIIVTFLNNLAPRIGKPTFERKRS